VSPTLKKLHENCRRYSKKTKKMPKSDGHVLTYDKSFSSHVLAPSPSSLGFPAVLPTNPSTISLSLLPICFVYFLTVTVFLERPSLDMVKIAQLQAAATFLEVLWNWS
jgi:hypothetical protein